MITSTATITLGASRIIMTSYCMKNHPFCRGYPESAYPHSKTRFVRVDSDTIDNLIRKDDVNKVTLNEDEKNALQEMFKSQLPKIEKTDFIVTFEALGENSNPVMLTQSEYMRRMREMSAMQPGMSFYGELPDNYNLVLNTDHELVKKILTCRTTPCTPRPAPPSA